MDNTNNLFYERETVYHTCSRFLLRGRSRPKQILQLGDQGLVAEGDSDVGHVGASNVVPEDALLLEEAAQPVALQLVLEAALENRVPGQLTHVTRAQFPHLKHCF